MSVRVAVIGLGYWGPNLARVVAAAEGGRLVALCDPDPNRLDHAAGRYPDARTFSDPLAVFADPGIDAVVLTTPADTHFELARAALEAGKHVLVEKPMARTVVEADELVSIASERSLVLMPGHVFLYNAAVRKVRDYIESGELGDIYYVYSQRSNLGQVRRDVNAMWNFAPHDISIIAHWLDAVPDRVAARGFSFLQPGIDDVVFLTLDYPGGIGAHAHISWLDPHKVRLMTVVGSEKMLVYDDVSADARIRLYDKGVTRTRIAGEGPPAQASRYETFAEFQLLLRAGDVLIPKIEFSEPLQAEMDDFLAAIRDGRPPLSHSGTGRDVVRVLEAAQRSLDLTGVPVDM
jgi:predicted dehydrogenase